MAQKLTAALPPDFDLPANFIVQLAAVNPTTGANVAGVNVSNVAIMAAPITPDTEESGPLFVPTTPLWLPIPVDEQATTEGG
jgi:hypothetical protein